MTPPAQDQADFVVLNPELHLRPVLPDATELDSLLVEIRAKLSSDVFGNFRIEGARTTNDPRHAGLGIVIKLMDELEVMKTAMEKISLAPTPETITENKKPGKANNNVLSTIRNAVEQQLDGPIRDMRIEIDRLKLRDERREQDMNNLRAQLVKSANRGGLEQPKAAPTESSNVGRKIKAFEAKQSATTAGLRTEIEQVRSLAEATNTKRRLNARKIQALDARVDESEHVTSSQRGDHHDLLDAHNNLFDRFTALEAELAAREDTSDQVRSRFDQACGMWVVSSRTK